jgi:D-threo-aldose 1-dehydrogenase
MTNGSLAICGVEVTRLGFGGAPLGDLYAKLPESEVIATVHTAYEASIRLFDTAPPQQF